MQLFDYPYIIITILILCFIALTAIGIYFAVRGAKTAKGKEEKDFVIKMKERFPRIMKLDKPLTLEQAKKLKDKYDTDLLAKVMTDMENWKPLLKKSVSAYMTINKWCQMELDRQ